MSSPLLDVLAVYKEFEGLMERRDLQHTEKVEIVRELAASLPAEIVFPQGSKTVAIIKSKLRGFIDGLPTESPPQETRERPIESPEVGVHLQDAVARPSVAREPPKAAPKQNRGQGKTPRP